MEKIKEVLKRNIGDQLSAFILLGVLAISIIGPIVIQSISNHNEAIEANAKLKMQEEMNDSTESMKNLTSIEKINNAEELKKINEKELKEAEKKEKDKNKSNKEDTPPYYIKVNYGAQVVNIYGKDSNGNYTVPVKAMTCSTGTYTPESGVYQVPNKFRWLDMLGDVYAQYCTQVVGDILFHSVPYLTKYDHSSLEYWAYDQLGSRVSLGCIRLTCKDAKWIYDNCRIGTKVEFYSSSNPGPLGKPSTRMISDAPANIRGWDPTDPDPDNPWGKYLKEQEKKKEEDKKNKDKNKGNNKDNNKNNNNKKDEDDKKQNAIINDIVNEITNTETNETIEDNTEVNQVEDPPIVNETINEVDVELNIVNSNA